SDQDSIEHVDLDGGFLMPSFGDGHAHPIFGGMEAEGPQVRACSSVDEIVAEVPRYAAAHPDEKWITGASYDGSLVAGGLFDARWLAEAVSDRPVVLRAWDYHTVWCNSRARELAGITAETPDPEIGEIPRREDGSPLGTLREWGAVDLIDAVRPPQEESVRLRALERAADYYRRRGVTWVRFPGPHPRHRRRRGQTGTRRHRIDHCDQCRLGPSPRHRARSARRRRGPRPLRRTRHHREHAAPVGSARRTHDRAHGPPPRRRTGRESVSDGQHHRLRRTAVLRFGLALHLGH